MFLFLSLIICSNTLYIIGSIVNPIINPSVGVIPLVNPENTGSPINPIIRYVINIIKLSFNGSNNNIINTTNVCNVYGI